MTNLKKNLVATLFLFWAVPAMAFTPTGDVVVTQGSKISEYWQPMVAEDGDSIWTAGQLVGATSENWGQYVNEFVVHANSGLFPKQKTKESDFFVHSGKTYMVAVPKPGVSVTTVVSNPLPALDAFIAKQRQLTEDVATLQTKVDGIDKAGVANFVKSAAAQATADKAIGVAGTAKAVAIEANTKVDNVYTYGALVALGLLLLALVISGFVRKLWKKIHNPTTGLDATMMAVGKVRTIADTAMDAVTDLRERLTNLEVAYIDDQLVVSDKAAVETQLQKMQDDKKGKLEIPFTSGHVVTVAWEPSADEAGFQFRLTGTGDFNSLNPKKKGDVYRITYGQLIAVLVKAKAAGAFAEDKAPVFSPAPRGKVDAGEALVFSHVPRGKVGAIDKVTLSTPVTSITPAQQSEFGSEGLADRLRQTVGGRTKRAS